MIFQLGYIYKNNLVIPFDKINYHIIAYKDDTSDYCFDLGIKFDLICNNYYNYAQTSCLNTIPEGYFVMIQTIKQWINVMKIVKFEKKVQ